ncbi:MAG: phosphoribosylaminoimidazolesuccinocarboxamide synthase [Gammaproteobacteria bacterium]|nr:phosphoribosylaminoimidazolesuccinocarboxamide synthase [Gammaproteobacteria bacterium]
MTSALFDSHIPNLPLIHRGKVRDIYGVDEKHLLIVTTDRLSAFDVILPTPIPGKGEVLTQTALFWFKRFEKLIPNHLATDLTLEDVIPDAQLRAMLAPRTMLVKKLKALPIEAIARGYLIGSGWKDYQATGKVCGIPLPAGLRLADKLPEPIYTPSSKAAVGEHDENIDFEATVRLVGPKLAEQVRDMTLHIYKEAADYALQRGIIIADTKFEFGIDEHGILHLIDEVLTPDSSRFWPLDTYAPGQNPESFDKQFVRDFLETLDWDKTPPGPELPPEIVERTASKYREAIRRLTA